MIVRHYTELAALPLAMEGAEDVLMRKLVGESEGAPHFSMRIFEVADGGHTPLHQHDYEHEIFILEGRGEITEGTRVLAIMPGSVIYIRPRTPHQLRNTQADVLRFIDIIPNQAAVGGEPVIVGSRQGPTPAA